MGISRQNLNATVQQRRIEAQRESARRRKRAERERRTPDELRAQKAREDVLCLDAERLERHIDRSGEGGCWLWQGGYVTLWSGPRPIMRAGQYGRVLADVAVWLVHHEKRDIPRGAFLKRACGNIECVSPHHALATNHVVERAKKRRQKGGEHGDLQEGPQRRTG